MKNRLRSNKALSLTIAAFFAVSTILIVGTNNVLAQNNFNEADFKIKDFGIKDGTPWLTVDRKS